MRIIGGTYKRKGLSSVPGMDTRPTSDRLRESIFNILSARVRDAVVLDLFAGTGALGLEALSRGARQGVFVDNQKKALSIIRKNIAACNLEPSTRVVSWDLARNASCIKGHTPPFDLVFMDPPYGLDLVPRTLQNLAIACCLAPDALIVCEHGAQDPVPDSVDAWVMSDQRRYGRTIVSFYEPSHDPA